MATVLDALKGINPYPIPLRTLITTAEEREVELGTEATHQVLKSKPYNLAKADLFLWLSSAPNVSQGGQTYSFSSDERRDFRKRAQALYKEFDAASEAGAQTIYGYKGSRL